VAHRTLKNLKTLLIEDTKRLSNLNQLSGSSVVHLELSGGMTKAGTYESLEPLSKIPNIEELVLTHFGVNYGGLRPLGKCKTLRHMILDCRFPTEEYAFLSVHLPDVKCDALAPYLNIEGDMMGDKSVMVVGLRKPFLKPKKDSVRLERHVADFQRMQNEFSNAK
jgi:hypothetical protein